jgi:glycosyltransferase involved in cell wall biosynthesis
MHVLHVMATGQTSGGAQHLLTLLPALAHRGVQVSAIVGADGRLAERLQECGIACQTLPLMTSRLSPRGLALLARRVRQVDADVVHYHGSRAAFFGAFAVFGVPAVYTVHGLSFRQHGSPLWRASLAAAELMACSRARRVVAVARADADLLRAWPVVAAGRLDYLPNSLDPTRLVRLAKSAARRRLGLVDDAFVVGTVGRLVEGKAVVDLVNAAARCQRRPTVIVAGDGPERGALAARARELGVELHLLGERTDVATVLSALDLFALTSRWEGEPLALLEARAMGVPCLATATSGAAEVLAGTGTLVPVGDVTALTASIDQAVALDDAGHEDLAASFAPTLAARSPERAAERLASIYTVCRAGLRPQEAVG